MTDITVNVDNAEVVAELRRLQQAVSNMTPVFKAIGQVIKSEIELTFRDTKSPDGINWQALSPVTIARRRNNSSVPLNDTGRLKNSLTYVADDKKVQVGTNLVYAAMQNFGKSKAQMPTLWGDVPARPFLPSNNLPSDWEQEILTIIRRHLSV